MILQVVFLGQLHRVLMYVLYGFALAFNYALSRERERESFTVKVSGFLAFWEFIV